MDNLNNKLITRQEVENILNYFENIGDNGTRLAINNLEHYQQAFIHESYYQSVQYHFTKGETVKEDNTLFSYVPKESSERLEYLGDHILKRSYVDKENLFVTGGSGGGVLTAWIIGKTTRFKAAVVAKPVINWYSFVLYADNINIY